MTAYLGMSNQAAFESRRVWDNLGDDSQVKADSLELANRDGLPACRFSVDEDVVIRLSISVFVEMMFQVSYTVINAEDILIFSTEADLDPQTYQPGHYTYTTTIPGNFLVPDEYRIHMAIHYPERKMYFEDEKAIGWSVLETGSEMSRYQPGDKYGVVLKKLDWNLDRHDS